MPHSSMSPTDASVFDCLNEKFHRSLELKKFYNSGSTARVYRVLMPAGDESGFTVDRIIKVFRHDGVNLSLSGIEDVFQQEVRSLTTVSHQNVIGLYSAGHLDFNEIRIPFFIMEFLEGALDFDEFIDKNVGNLDSSQLMNLFLQISSGLGALHDAGILHCDLKFGNLLVGRSGTVKIADLGFSKTVETTASETGVKTTFNWFPHKYNNYIQTLEDRRQTNILIPRNKLNESFDLHYLSQVISTTISRPRVAALLNTLELKGLELIAERMNLDDSPRLPRLKSARALSDAILRLRPLGTQQLNIDEVGSYTGTRTIRIPFTGSIPFTRRVQEIISHPLFLRLHGALQLGLTHYIFPGARHTRFEHSLGVYANVGKYISALLSDDSSPYFRQLVDRPMIATTVLAGLLHDIGQHSFAHTLEELRIAPHHEKVAELFIRGDGAPVLDGLTISDMVPEEVLKRGAILDCIKKSWPEVDTEWLISLISGGYRNIKDGEVGWEIMRSIISGPLDADKTDYLLRDALHSGVEYARSIDLTRFMNSLTVAVVNKRGNRLKGSIAVTWKGIQSAENIVLARSQMFWVLYWHKTVRSAQAMVGHSCFEHLSKCTKKQKQIFYRTLYGGDVGQILSLLQESKSERAANLAVMLQHRCLFKRGIELDYRDEPGLYRAMTEAKDKHEGAGDLLLKGLARSVVEAINAELADAGSSQRLNEDDVILDIPVGKKDQLGNVFVVNRDGSVSEQYESRVLVGMSEDWQNRVRTVRVFTHPRIESRERAIIDEKGQQILGRAM